MAVFKKVGGFSGKFFQINCWKNEESISPLAEWDGNFGLLALMQNDNPGWNGNRKGSSFESSKAFKSINALHQIFCLNLMDTEATKGMPSMSSECVDDLAGLPKNTWSKMDLMPDVLDPGWSDGSNGGCSCADGGFWDVCFKMAAANFSCQLQGKHQPAEYRHTSQGSELQPDWLHCRWR